MSTQGRVFEVLETVLGSEAVFGATPESNLIDDLAIDSLDQTELLSQLEEEFSIEISREEEQALETIGDVIRLVESKVGGHSGD